MRKIVAEDNSLNVNDAVKNIPGWGYDADLENNPSYPMKRYNGADHKRLNYPRSVQQPQFEEILHSNERPSVTTVFGASVPPKGISGALRRFAFTFSEGSAAHWLTLLLADRVNVVEGIAEDVVHGKVPNIFIERGWKAEWKHNRKGAITSIAVAVGVIGLLYWASKKKQSKMISVSA